MAKHIAHRPAPWTLTGQGWIFLLHQPFSRQPVSLPAGAVSLWESDALGQRFHGGYGAVLIVRYDSSDVGPYDELMYIPGWFSSSEEAAQASQYRHTISRIYVSTEGSVLNGRTNWGIPMFGFTPSDAQTRSVRIQVAHPNTKEQPFFDAVVSDSALTPFSAPLATAWVDHRITRWITGGYEAQLVQPPLPTAAPEDSVGCRYAIETGQNPSWLVGTDKTWLVKPESTGRAKICSIQPSRPPKTVSWTKGFGDGDGFPTFTPAFSGMGLHLTSFSMEFVVPAEI